MHVVCVGDCGVDRYLPLAQDRAGSITLNFAVHARRLFAPEDRVTVVSALGDDTEANIVTAALDELLIEAHLAELPGRTSLQHIDLDPSGEKIFVRYEQGVLGDYRVGSLERAILKEADLLVAPHYEQISGFFDSVMNTPSKSLRVVDFADIAQHPSAINLRRLQRPFRRRFSRPVAHRQHAHRGNRRAGLRNRQAHRPHPRRRWKSSLVASGPRRMPRKPCGQRRGHNGSGRYFRGRLFERILRKPQHRREPGKGRSRGGPDDPANRRLLASSQAESRAPSRFRHKKISPQRRRARGEFSSACSCSAKNSGGGSENR